MQKGWIEELEMAEKEGARAYLSHFSSERIGVNWRISNNDQPILIPYTILYTISPIFPCQIAQIHFF